MKTQLANHLRLHTEDQIGYISVTNSETLVQFGRKYMSQPGSQAKLNTRNFIDIKPEEVKDRKKNVGQVRTLAGIMRKYEYICFPNGKVMWRRLPCCCISCRSLQWNQCTMSYLVGDLETVIQPGSTLYTGKQGELIHSRRLTFRGPLWTLKGYTKLYGKFKRRKSDKVNTVAPLITIMI